MGILADDYGVSVDRGLDWYRIKDQVMKLGASEDYIIVSLYNKLTFPCKAWTDSWRGEHTSDICDAPEKNWHW